MTATLFADSVVNLCGALGLCLAVATLRRRDPKGATTLILNMALGWIALFLVLRGLAWLTGSASLDRISVGSACFVPLAALIATEATLRRHAPLILKVSALGGSLSLGLAGLFIDNGQRGFLSVLAVFQLFVLAACAFLLFGRDRASLTRAENKSIARFGAATCLALPLVITDFRALFPDMPVRLGALGVLLAMSLLLAEGAVEQYRRRALALFALRVVAALVLGVIISRLEPAPSLSDVLRSCAVTAAGVLSIGLIADTLGGRFDSREAGVLGSLATLKASNRDDLVAALGHHPIFAQSQRCRLADLADYDPPILLNILRANSVVRRADWPWGREMADPGVERVAAMMACCEATHLLVIDTAPLDLLVVSVPVVAADAATEIALRLLCRVLAGLPDGQEGRERSIRITCV